MLILKKKKKISFAFTWVVGLVAAHRDQFPINFQKYSLNSLEFTAIVRCGVDIDVNFYIRQKPFWFLRKFWDVDCSKRLIVFWHLRESVWHSRLLQKTMCAFLILFLKKRKT